MRKLILIGVLFLAGCVKDDRAKQASNLLNVMTQTAAQEYRDAKTPEAKDAVAQEYFKQAPKFTQGIDDYMHNRPPTPPPPPPKTVAEPVPDEADPPQTDGRCRCRQ